MKLAQLQQLDGASLDRQYNNRALVPDFAEHLARWAADSAQARTQPCTLDLAYGAGPSESLDIFPAAGSAKAGGAPVLVFLHGGYWRGLDKADTRLWLRRSPSPAPVWWCPTTRYVQPSPCRRS